MADISCKREQSGVYSGFAERSRNCAGREYAINKGIGRSVEYKGLKAQYLFIFAGGLLALFVVFVIMYIAGVSQWICIGFGVLPPQPLCGSPSISMPSTGNTV